MSDKQSGGKIPVQLIAIPLLAITAILSAIFFLTESDRLRTYPLTDYDVEIPTDSTSINHGRRLFAIRGCIDCHGTNLGGKIIESGLITGLIAAPNLTSGRGSAISGYSNADLVRVIREGVKPNGKSVIMMPSHKFQVIHKRDLESLIAYIKSAESIDRKLPETELSFPLRIYYFINRELALFPANKVKRPAELPQVVPDNRRARAKYVASSCVGCHGYKLKGGQVPGVPPYWPEAPDLTSSGIAGEWTKQEFIDAMEKGITPDGRHIDEQFMPWPAFGKLTEEEFDLLWEYLKSL
jgi:mono/diheme cytochrome c family protein